MKVKRILHIRAPLMMYHVISKRQITEEVLPDRLGARGGATIVLEGDTDKPGFITMKTARCNVTDSYNRKKGLKTANEKDPEVVPLRKLASVLRAEEHHMLLSCVPALRRDEEALNACTSDYDWVTRLFLPLPVKESKEQPNG